MVLTLFHAQASLERGFNINKAMLQPNLRSKSLTSQRLIHDHMKATIQVQNQWLLLNSLGILLKGHETNKELIWQKEKKQSYNARKRKRDAIVTDIKELKAKKIALEKVEKKLKTDSECC